MTSAADFAAPASVSVVIAGGGKITNRHVSDLMDDWLRLDAPDPVDARIWLPGDTDTYSDVVEAAAKWARLKGRPGNSVVVAGELVDASVEPYGGESYVVSAAEIHAGVAETLMTVLQEDEREEQRTPYVILAWGEQDDAPDAFTEELMTAASEAGIPILEIAAKGLEELGARGDAEEEAVQEATGKDSLSVAEPDEAQATPSPAAEPAQPSAYGLVYTLRQCERLVQSEIDRHEALFDEPAEPPLMQALVYWLKRVRNEGPEAVLAAEDSTPRVEVTTITPEPEPAARKGRSRAKAGQVSVFLSQDGIKAIETGFMPGITDIKIANGRPRTGWVRRAIDQEFVPASLINAV